MFNNPECLADHVANGVCDRATYCTECGRWFPQQKESVGIGSLYLIIISVFANNNFDGNLICVDSTNRTFIFTCFLCTK